MSPPPRACRRTRAWSCWPATSPAPAWSSTCVRPGYDAVYHLAAVVSGAAEADIDLGYAVNLDGTRHLLDAIRAFAAKPRLVFASSCAVFGGAMPEVLGDDTPLTPQTSYGAQKAMGELLVADFHRKGLLDGRSLRLPTICVRPGKPNKAASTWASSIFREPLAGQEAVCPVSRDSAMYLLSPRRVVDALVHAMELPSEALGTTRHINLPGTTYSVAEMVDALERVAGKTVTARIRWEPDAIDPEDRRRLAATLRHAARRAAGLQGRRQHGRDRPAAHRGRAGRQVRPLTASAA